MNTMKLVIAATVATGMLASPALAKDKMKRAHNAQAQSAQMADGSYRADMRSRDTGFWPADVAAGAVGGAIGVAGAAVNTAGAIATAPFRPWEGSYAYYNDQDRYAARDSYARRNNFVCQPGTWFRGEDGQRHICQ